MKKIQSFFLLFILLATISLNSGCRQKKATTTKAEKIELVYYKLFDDESLIQPMIQKFESKYKNVKIKYKKFTDVQEYEDMIINELAEGEGPDIYEIHNSWILKHKKKIQTMPQDIVTPQLFRDTFVKVAADDLIQVDEKGIEQIYGIPLTIDTLALYYNEEILEDKIPSRGKPGTTWDEIKEDVYKINKQDLSKERFEISGIAMGRHDNIQRAIDILYLLLLQNETDFYNSDFTKATFAEKQGVSSSGKANYPGKQALDLFTQFALPSNKHYSWNTYISDTNSTEKELKSFIEGKTAMIIGYSYLLESLQSLIDTYEKNNKKSIKASDIKIAAIPQLSENGPSINYASYFAETVSRTSKHPRESWQFIKFMASKENQQYINKSTHKPTSRRDLISEQTKDPIYGIFTKQIGFAKSFLMSDPQKYNEIFSEAIENVLKTKTASNAINIAQDEINTVLPKEGLLPELSNIGEKEDK